MKQWKVLPLMMLLLLATSCTTYHFGVKDKAEQVPDEFGQTEALIARAAQSPGAQYCPEKIARAKELGRQAIETYWVCNNDEAARLLAEARQLAADAERCGPLPKPVVQPGPTPAPPVQAAKICITLHVEFDFDKSDVKPQYHNEISKVAEFMTTYPSTGALIEGHTDNVGSYGYNISLSERRAESVRTYLVEQFGIDPPRLTTKGYGYTKPVASNETDEGRQKNRRIDALIDCSP
jgi:outer membrane protein OmpA-like peptidoglycan-associated protein